MSYKNNPAIKRQSTEETVIPLVYGTAQMHINDVSRYMTESRADTVNLPLCHKQNGMQVKVNDIYVDDAGTQKAIKNDVGSQVGGNISVKNQGTVAYISLDKSLLQSCVDEQQQQIIVDLTTTIIDHNSVMQDILTYLCQQCHIPISINSLKRQNTLFDIQGLVIKNSTSYLELLNLLELIYQITPYWVLDDNGYKVHYLDIAGIENISDLKACSIDLNEDFLLNADQNTYQITALENPIDSVSLTLQFCLANEKAHEKAYDAYVIQGDNICKKYVLGADPLTENTGICLYINAQEGFSTIDLAMKIKTYLRNLNNIVTFNVCADITSLKALSIIKLGYKDEEIFVKITHVTVNVDNTSKISGFIIKRIKN